MSTVSAEVIRWGEHRIRTGPWRGGQVAFIAPVPGAPTPSSAFIQHCLGLLASRGFTEVVTSALSPGERDGFYGAGFKLKERLHLLMRSRYMPLPPLMPFPKGEKLVRVPKRKWREVLDIDREAFTPFWQLDQLGLEEALNATPQRHFRACRIGHQRLSGYAICGLAGSRGFVQRLAVSQSSRNHGMGGRLLLEGLHWLQAHGAGDVAVNTQMGNEPALSLYYRFGFEDDLDGLSVLWTTL